MLRRGVLAGLAVLALALAATASTATHPAAAGTDATASIRGALTKALAAKGVDPRRTGALVVDVASGRIVFERNADLSLAPASAEKLPVSFAALALLGPAFRYRTEVVGDGALIGDEWRGDLYLVGYGDPTLAIADVGRLARDVKAAGIRRVTGRVLGDESRYDSRRTAPGWKPSFLGIESPPLSALVVKGVAVVGANGSASAAASQLSSALAVRGVVVAGGAGTGRAPAGATPLAVDHSVQLKAIVGKMNRDSDNFVSEMVLKELGAAVARRGSTATGATVVRRELAASGIPVAGVRLVDGSGLSGHDRLTARSLVTLLRTAAGEPEIGGDFLASLAVAGVSGTLRNRLGERPTRGRVSAKTGTTSRAAALAGFVGRRYAFAILQNGSPLAYWPARAAQDRFVTVLARSR